MLTSVHFITLMMPFSLSPLSIYLFSPHFFFNHQKVIPNQTWEFWRGGKWHHVPRLIFPVQSQVSRDRNGAKGWVCASWTLLRLGATNIWLPKARGATDGRLASQSYTFTFHAPSRLAQPPEKTALPSFLSSISLLIFTCCSKKNKGGKNKIRRGRLRPRHEYWFRVHPPCVIWCRHFILKYLPMGWHSPLFLIKWLLVKVICIYISIRWVHWLWCITPSKSQCPTTTRHFNLSR